ncbi:hypothetical protein QBC47DRAFT_325622, partial [Echria macrotheca]
MNLDGWEEIDSKSAEPAEQRENDDPSPAYEDVVYRRQRKADGPPQLHILGATWGGVNVTAEVSAMVGDDETLSLNMHTLHHSLQPDPVFGVVKTLTVLYRYDEGRGDVRLLNVPEYIPSETLRITPTAHDEDAAGGYLALVNNTTWREGQVEILAVCYGPQRIKSPAVMRQLASYFEGRCGQIRMTNAFFTTDPWVGHRKSWSIYFRFVGSRRIQCVTGMEDGALETPWTR